MNLRDQLQQALGSAYRIERELGQGGMAIVFLTEDVKHQRRVAAKVLRPELAAALGADRFTRETELPVHDAVRVPVEDHRRPGVRSRAGRRPSRYQARERAALRPPRAGHGLRRGQGVE